MNTFDDDNELGFFEEPRRRPPRDRERRPPRTGRRRSGPPAGQNGVIRFAGLIALGIAVVLGFVLWVGSCGGGSKQGYSAYFAAMQPLAHDSASVGAEFATAAVASGLTLQSFESSLTDWARREQADYVAAQRLRPPGPLQSAHAEALATFQLRYAGLTRIAGTLALAQSKHDSASVAAAALASEAQLLSASDIVWMQLYKLAATQVLKDQGVTAVIPPGSQIVTNPDTVSAHSLSILYQRVGTPSNGGHVTGRHGSDLLYTNAVENGVSKQLSTSSAAATTVAVGPNLEIDVVFKNSGAYPEFQIPVTLSLRIAGKTVSPQTKTVAQIAKGEQTTVSFTNLQVPNAAFGHNAFIVVSIGRVLGEARFDNNAATYPVLLLLAPN